MSESHRAGVLGSPIDHSLSPVLYRAGFSAAGLTSWQFEAIDCDAAALPGLVGALGPEWAGLAVTMPGKGAAAAVAATCSERVEVLGVANTLLRSGTGWHADNTDVDGVVGALRAAKVPAEGPVLIIGGGGTARAVLLALVEMSWQGPVIAAGRTPESCVILGQIATRLGVQLTHTGMAPAEIAAIAGDLALAVSTVPAGAADHLATGLAHVPALFDVIYHPWPTPLAVAGHTGRTTVTGLDMLLHQALAQFRLVTGQQAPAEAMRQSLRAAVRSELPLPI